MPVIQRLPRRPVAPFSAFPTLFFPEVRFPLSLVGPAARFRAGPGTAPDTRAAAPVPATPVASPLIFYGFVNGYFGYDFYDPVSHVRSGFLYSHNRTNEFALS